MLIPNRRSINWKAIPPLTSVLQDYRFTYLNPCMLRIHRIMKKSIGWIIPVNGTWRTAEFSNGSLWKILCLEHNLWDKLSSKYDFIDLPRKWGYGFDSIGMMYCPGRISIDILISFPIRNNAPRLSYTTRTD